MNQQRWLRGEDETAAFDWRRAARDLDVPLETARGLYARAMRTSDDLRRAEGLYRRWLRAAAEGQRTEAAPAPGRQTRVIQERRGEGGEVWRPEELAALGQLGPGKWTRSLIEAARDEAAAPPSYAEVQQAIGALAGTTTSEAAGTASGLREELLQMTRDAGRVVDPAQLRGALRDELVRIARGGDAATASGSPDEQARIARGGDAARSAATASGSPDEQARIARGGDAARSAATARRPAAVDAATAAELRDELVRIARETGRGVGEALAAVNPATAAEAVRELRRQGIPVLRLVTQAAGGEVERVMGRSSAGSAMPSSVAERMTPHVGGEATAAARVHTDEAADVVAASHHARALTVGSDIYFARGEFAPGTERGDELLAHELTHVAQGQRGELARAAAKGIDSGGMLEPGEAEAELRAKVAVIQLHAPAAAAPPLASPQGQPASAGERQARISAQNQRLSQAGQGAEPLAVPPAPPATRAAAPVAHAAPPLKAPPPAASTGNAYVDAFNAPPSKQATELWGKAGSDATTKVAADQAKFDAGLAPMPVVLDGRELPGGKTAAAGGRQPGAGPSAGTAPPSAVPTPTPAAPVVKTATTAAAQLSPTADKATIQADGQKLIDNLPTSSPEVKTDPGPAPVTDLAGQADPVRTVGDHQHAIGEGAKALDEAKTKIVSGPGAAQIQPAKLNEKLAVPKEQATGAMPQLPTVEGMQKLKKWNLPTNALGSFDELAKPKMEASLATAKAKMTEADGKRDADRTKAVTDAQDKVKAAHADADKQQQAKVADTRSQIANHQAETLVKHEGEVKKLDQQSTTKKQGAIGKINTRIAADQAKVEGDYQDAAKKAEDQKKKGEEDAKKKKEEAEKKKEDKSWWDQAVDTVCDGIKAIAEEIDKALEAIGKAIGEILDAVKDAACKVIDAARDFVCQALTEFGDWLKSAVTALIGSVFPELAAALNRLIDQAVNAAKAAVNAIADGLKAAVTALCDSLKGALDGIIAAFRAAVQAASTLAQALITGDWAMVGKMVLEGILKLLGIDPAAFYALIGKAMDSIDKIIENPGAFVGHLVDAVKLGFKQFGANFWTHLKNGVVQWLFGTFAEAGIHMPASFDVAGIFDLVCQVLGLTWPRLRGKVVKVIGEKNTERLEFVGKYLQALVTGGFSGLWQQVQQDMSGLWDMVIGGVKDWIIEKVVQTAIVKIATMWNPAGAIIQLIQTAWNVYQWVRENAQRIFGLVQAVVDSISNIVAGNIGGAANFIEASLAKLVPIAISLFANLLGLGGIADKIKSVIEKVQTKVDQAIDKLIDRVMKMFKGKDGKGDGKGDGKEGDHSVGETITFEAAGHGHKLWFEVKGQQATLMVASTPVPVKTHLSQMQGQVGKLPDDKQATAKTLLGNATAAEAKATTEANKASHADGNAKDTADGKAAGADERTVADLMKQLFEIFEGQNAADLKGACDKAGGVPKTKFANVMGESQAGAVAVRPSFLAGANVRLKDAPEKPLDAMRNEVSGSGDKYILKGDPIPVAEIVGQKGISRVLDLPSVFNYYLDAGYKSRLKLASAEDFLKACGEGKFNPATDLNNAAEIRGKVAESWWFAKARAGGVTLGQIKKDLTVMDTTYDKGMLRLNITAAELAAANITLHKPTAFDGMMQGWGDDPMWTAAPGAWGLTRDGMQEGVIKASTLGVFKDRHLILPEPMPKTDEVPKALAENQKIELTHVSEAIEAEAKKTPSGTVLYESNSGDPKAVTKALLTQHPEAKLDAATGVLTLPAVKGDGAAANLRALAAQVAQSTGVSKITFVVTDKGWRLDGAINPTVDGLVWHTATGAGLDPLVKSLQAEIGKQQPNRDLLIAICRERAAKFGAKVEFEYFPREDVTLVAFTELTPAPGKSPGTFTVDILPGSPAAGTKDATCPSCHAATGVSKPHNVIPASMWKGIIADTLKKAPYSVTTSDAYYESIIAVGSATGGPAVTQDKQCPACEAKQDAKGTGGPYSLVQRMGAPSTKPDKQGYVGNQFKDTNPDQALELTKLKIEQVSAKIRSLLGLASTGAAGARPATSQIYTNIVTPGLTDTWLHDMEAEALKRATAPVAAGDYPP